MSILIIKHLAHQKDKFRIGDKYRRLSIVLRKRNAYPIVWTFVYRKGCHNRSCKKSVWQRSALINLSFLAYEVVKKKIMPPHRRVGYRLILRLWFRQVFRESGYILPYNDFFVLDLYHRLEDVEHAAAMFLHAVATTAIREADATGGNAIARISRTIPDEGIYQ